MKPVISVKNLSKEFKTKQKEQGLMGSIKSIFAPKYRRLKAVNNISFEVARGELLAFIGPNGAGKSTTLKILTGILFPDSGQVDVLGFTPWKKRKKLAYEIGTVFGQKQQLWYHLPAIDTYNLFAKIYELDEDVYRRRLKRLAKVVGISDFMNTPVRKLSLGQRMRAELVAALLHNPKVLYLDEPSIGLDIIAKKNFRELILKLNREEKLTIILTSHDMMDIEKLCNRVIIINHGDIVYEGSISDIKHRFMKTKIVEIRFRNGVPKFKYGKIIKKGKFGVKLEIDTTKQSVEKLLKSISDDIEDINISDPPIEDIISKIYRR